MNKESFNDESFITTKDNPFDYFTQFDQWQNYDMLNGYHTLELVARTVATSGELSEADQKEDFDYAFDKIVEWRGDLYKKVHRRTEKGD